MEHNDIVNDCCCENSNEGHRENGSGSHAKESQKYVYKFRWKPLLRQLFVCSGVWVSYFMYGLSMGAPTVFIPQIRREANSTTIIDQEMASWISSIIPYAGMPFAFILPVLTRFAGRRITFLIIALTSFVGYIILITSTTIRDLLISEAMYGLLAVSCHTILPIIITEYTLPRYRGIFLTLKTACFFWGIWISNAIGTFFHWKNIGYFGICCSVCVFVNGFFWHESPYWLATIGRFKECMDSHRYLKGCSPDAEKELEELMISQKSVLENNLNNCRSNNTLYGFVNNFLSNICNEELYKPTLMSLLMMTLYHSSGKIACTIYAIELIKKITQSESTAYKGMLILDGVTVFGMYIGCILSRFLKRRTLMIYCSCLGVAFLFIISLYLYLIKIDCIVESSIISILLLTFYQLSISCGPIILSSSIYSEMVPIKFISYSMFAMAFYSLFLMAMVIKFSPAIFVKFGLHTAFLFYGIATGICTFFVYKYLPETKDKTLQEMEEYFKTNRKESKKLIIRTDDTKNNLNDVHSHELK